jgi:NAD(P)-dependent dehydrogenase (short-subunit alcohol dehydrogenase family)
MNVRLDGKRALVTGGNSGLGAAIALALADSGARVAINYLAHPKATDALVRKIKKKHGEAIPIQADVSDPGAVEKMFCQIDATWKGIDIPVNNAGLDGVRALCWETDIAEWRKVLEVNLFGAFYCAREALKRMTARKSGVVLNLTSVHEKIAWSGYSAYATSKSGVSMMTKTLAQEAAPFGVRVVSIAPGAIRTPINRAVWSSKAGMADLLEKIPLNRIGEPEDIARMAVFLASDAASYVTGCTILVDGGMSDYPDFAHGG